ncbi:helix-turn-helix domain-containing protein [Niveispirillum fermenti]|uniref:helix-turn-helix domain-containing protein n=1 Tax=Niveispirillum fermenti TaxID=1233113 RepID=UPI003A8747CB
MTGGISPRLLLRLVETRLDEPDLSPAAIAVAAGISVRHLHRLFAAMGLRFADHVRACRLERCRAALGDPVQGARSVTDIAFSWGFNDAAHFSRCFRAAYGTSPRAWRASRVAGGALAA